MRRERFEKSIVGSKTIRTPRKSVALRWEDPATGKVYVKQDANFLGNIDPHDYSGPVVDNVPSFTGRTASKNIPL